MSVSALLCLARAAGEVVLTAIDHLGSFGSDWLERLQSDARVAFSFAELKDGAGSPAQIADRYVTSLGFEAIGFNWELLDPGPDADAPRSALGQLTEALSHDIAQPNRPWLDTQSAQSCANQFVNAFDPLLRGFVSNRFDGLWNPIAGAPVEWGFVGYDEAAIALLLIVSD